MTMLKLAVTDQILKLANGASSQNLMDTTILIFYFSFKLAEKKKIITLMSCPLTASRPVPTILSQKARPEGATVSSHGASSAVAVSCCCKRTSRKPAQKPRPIASLLLKKVWLSFGCSCREKFSWLWLENLILDTFVVSRFLAGSVVLGALRFLGV